MERRCCILPKQIKQDREAFKALGFDFFDFGNKYVWQAVLPEGWELKQFDGITNTVCFLDQNGNEVGVCYNGDGNTWENSYVELT